MGNYWRKLESYIEEHVIISQLIDVLDRVIVNTQPKGRDAARLEEILNIVRTHAEHTMLVHHTMHMVNQSSMSDTFGKIIKEMQKDVKVYHLFTLYALFVDVCVQKPANDLKRLHYDIHCNLGGSVLKDAQSVMHSCDF